jgi:hypothetical protein
MRKTNFNENSKTSFQLISYHCHFVDTFIKPIPFRVPDTSFSIMTRVKARRPENVVGGELTATLLILFLVTSLISTALWLLLN